MTANEARSSDSAQGTEKQGPFRFTERGTKVLVRAILTCERSYFPAPVLGPPGLNMGCQAARYGRPWAASAIMGRCAQSKLLHFR